MLIPVLLGITVLAFGLGRLAPGDPVEEALAHVGIRAPSLAQIEAKRAELGLDDPLVIQYRNWLNRAVHGDLGTSCFSRIKISDEIARRLPVTLKVSLVAMAFTVILGVGLGLLMVLCAGGIWARCLNVLSVFLLSVPGFWLSIFLIVLFSEVLHLLPTSGQGTFFHLLMPALVLSSAAVGTTARTLRTALLNEMGEPYAAAARSKGLSRRLVLIRHAFRSALLPVVTLLGNHLGGLLGGAAIVETVFSLRGMGRYALDAIFSRDYNVVQAYVLVTGLTFVAMSLFIDVAYILLNPRIRLTAGRERG